METKVLDLKSALRGVYFGVHFGYIFGIIFGPDPCRHVQPADQKSRGSTGGAYSGGELPFITPVMLPGEVKNAKIKENTIQTVL